MTHKWKVGDKFKLISDDWKHEGKPKGTICIVTKIYGEASFQFKRLDKVSDTSACYNDNTNYSIKNCISINITLRDLIERN